jgi:hypothetical protein
MQIEDFLDPFREAASKLFESTNHFPDLNFLNDGTFWAAFGAIGTSIAAVATAYAAFQAKESAQAAKESVNEARLSRQSEKDPVLVFELDQFEIDVAFVGHKTNPHQDFLPNPPLAFHYSFLVVNEGGKQAITARMPTGKLTNYGIGPALDVNLKFEIIDNNEEISISQKNKKMFLRIEEKGEKCDKNFLHYIKDDGEEAAFSYAKTATNKIHVCGVNQTIMVDVPPLILRYIFMMGLNFIDRASNPDLGYHTPILVVTASCRSIFRDEIDPFIASFEIGVDERGTDPPMVSGHFGYTGQKIVG